MNSIYAQPGQRLQGIYRIMHIESGRTYVGRTVDYHSRQRAHVWHLERGKHHSSKLQRAWDKYGAEAFQFEFVEAVESEADLIPCEQTYLDGLQPFCNVALDAANPVLGATRLHCPQGHAYEGDNILWHGPEKTKRRCRACHNAQANARHHRRLADQGKTAVVYPRDRTHCPQGHSYAEHGGTVPNGWRYCMQCNREKASAVYHAKVAAEGRKVGTATKDRTHCPQGHPYTGENLLTKNDGTRGCRACIKVQKKQSEARARARKQAATDDRSEAVKVLVAA